MFSQYSFTYVVERQNARNLYLIALFWTAAPVITLGVGLEAPQFAATIRATDGVSRVQDVGAQASQFAAVIGATGSVSRMQRFGKRWTPNKDNVMMRHSISDQDRVSNRKTRKTQHHQKHVRTLPKAALDGIFCFSFVKTPHEPTLPFFAGQLHQACDEHRLFGRTADNELGVVKLYETDADFGPRQINMTLAAWDYFAKAGIFDRFQWVVRTEPDTYIRPAQFRAALARYPADFSNIISARRDGPEGYLSAFQTHIVHGATKDAFETNVTLMEITGSAGDVEDASVKKQFEAQVMDIARKQASHAGVSMLMQVSVALGSGTKAVHKLQANGGRGNHQLWIEDFLDESGYSFLPDDQLGELVVKNALMPEGKERSHCLEQDIFAKCHGAEDDDDDDIDACNARCYDEAKFAMVHPIKKAEEYMALMRAYP